MNAFSVTRESSRRPRAVEDMQGCVAGLVYILGRLVVQSVHMRIFICYEDSAKLGSTSGDRERIGEALSSGIIQIAVKRIMILDTRFT